MIQEPREVMVRWRWLHCTCPHVMTGQGWSEGEGNLPVSPIHLSSVSEIVTSLESQQPPAKFHPTRGCNLVLCVVCYEAAQTAAMNNA